jgi:hypothetical protein
MAAEYGPFMLGFVASTRALPVSTVEEAPQQQARSFFRPCGLIGQQDAHAAIERRFSVARFAVTVTKRMPVDRNTAGALSSDRDWCAPVKVF